MVLDIVNNSYELTKIQPKKENIFKGYNWREEYFRAYENWESLLLYIKINLE